MAYFSNGSEGMVFEEQCSRCKYGLKPCPIAWVQTNHNYEACNIFPAREILDHLVKDDGTCTMFEMCKQDFFIDKNQTELFES